MIYLKDCNIRVKVGSALGVQWFKYLNYIKGSAIIKTVYIRR